MSIVLTSDAVTHNPLVGSLETEASSAARHICRFNVFDDAGLFPFAHDDEVILTDDGTRTFGGILEDVGLGVPEECRLTQRVHELVAVDFRARCDQRIITKTYAAGQTLKQVLTDLRTSYLDVFGITMDPAQEDGPTLGAITWSAVSLRAALDQLQTATGWLWNVSYTKVFGAYDPADIPTAPFSITATSGNWISVKVSQPRVDYRNRQYLLLGTAGVFPHQYDQYGNGVKTRFTLPFVGIGFGIPGQCSVYRSGGGWTDYPVGWYPSDPQAWLYDNTGGLNDLVQMSGTVLGANDILRVVQSVQYPQTLVAENGEAATNPREAVNAAPDVYDYVTGTALVEGLLQRYGSYPKRLSIVTNTPGLQPRQLLPVTLSALGLSGSFLIASVRASQFGDTADMTYEAEAVGGTEVPEQFQETWREMQGGGSASAVTVISGSASGTSVLHADLGGARQQSVSDTSFVPVPEFKTFICPVSGSYTIRVERKTLDAGTTVQVRIYDVTAAAAAWTGATSTSSSWATETDTVALLEDHEYRAEVVAGNSSAEVMVGQVTVVLT